MSVTQGEHTFETEILLSGENVNSFSAGEALTAGEPVGLSADYTVTGSSAGGGDFIGVAAYDVASGEEVPVITRDCEVRVEVSEAVSAGDVIVPDGLGTFETVATSTASSGVAIVEDGAAAGELAEVDLFAVQGATA
jgi:hypothetical protein